MLFHIISRSDVRSGDHLYRWRYFKIFQGIAIERNDDNALTMFVLVPNESNSFHLISIENFRERGYLRRVLYNQGNSYLHPIKLSGTSFIDEKRPAEEIVRNALLLINRNNINSQFMKNLLAPGPDNFARLCCTMSHEQWRDYLHANEYTPTEIANVIKPTAPWSSIIGERFTLEESEYQPSCPICFDRSCDVAFDCGHLTCSQCAPLLTVCHICRQEIHQRIPLFWS